MEVFNRPGNLIRDFLFEVAAASATSIVGAVVIIAGAMRKQSVYRAKIFHAWAIGKRGKKHQVQVQQSKALIMAKRVDLPLGSGGAADASACNRALVAKWDSDTCRNFNIEKRRCFEVSSCTGGEDGRVELGRSVEPWSIPCVAASGCRNSAADGLRGICSLFRFSTSKSGALAEAT